MTAQFSVGDKVKWAWGEGFGQGEVKEIFTKSVTRSIKGTEVTRNASDDDPAYLIEQSDGDQVLKSQSEIEAGS